MGKKAIPLSERPVEVKNRSSVRSGLFKRFNVDLCFLITNTITNTRNTRAEEQK
jgi:hypothetical protein